MIKLWVQIITDGKIIKDLLYTSEEDYSRDTFFNVLTEVCYRLQEPTPVVLKTHLNNFENFNLMRFLPDDFVEPVNFDKMNIENALR